MKTEVKRDIQSAIKNVLRYIKSKDFNHLDDLSNHTIHNASIFQDEDSVSIAVVIYALSKIGKREKKIPPKIVENLKKSKELLDKNDLKSYSHMIRELSKSIEDSDSRMKLYIQNVINSAEIKKGSRIYEHGISMARTAHMLGLSQWELMEYVGKTGILDRMPSDVSDIVMRIKEVRKLFDSKTKFLIFDSGPIITMTMNHLMWVLDPLKTLFHGDFLISKSVQRELIETPLETKKFKFEALHTYRYIRKKTLNVFEDETLQNISKEIEDTCNSCFLAHGNPIKLVHEGEVDTLAIALMKKSGYVVVDERTTRLLIENPGSLKEILKSKLHTQITTDKKIFEKMNNIFSGLKVMRSVELITLAYEEGLLDRYLPDRPFNRITLLDAVLWGLKLNGCAVSEQEIMDIIAFENNKKSP